ncbi:hypothetical protein [Psychroflexus aestuariivivens]|uniref:hypothetical protein n=1 Tax=Psychroflexus aestuariivivens TaxID=1795040 RepID=UPI000FDBDC4E|nr:hypothetical protein [Psychroflexus aestuariivivens]
MIKFKIVLPVLMLCFLMLSCKALIYKLNVPATVKTEKLVNDEGREVVIFEMAHLAKPKFYRSVSEKIESLRQEGYVVYFESVEFEPTQDSLTKDRQKRKVRKLLGHDLTTDYKDSTNLSLPKHFGNSKYVMQSVENIGLDLESDKLVDLTAQEIIEKYEAKYGEMELNECDLNTDFGEKYECTEAGEVDSFYALNTIREDYIAEYVSESSDQKIALVYGKSHHYFIRANLRDLAGFQPVD